MLELLHDTGSYEGKGVLAYEGEKISARRFIGAEQVLRIQFIPEHEACLIETPYFTN